MAPGSRSKTHSTPSAPRSTKTHTPQLDDDLMFDNDDEPGMFPLPDPGTNNFNELLYARKFLKALTKLQARGMPKNAKGAANALRTHEKDWYVFDGKAWVRRKRAVFESLALS